MFLSYKLNFKLRAIQVQAQFKFAFPQHLPPSKIAILGFNNYQKITIHDHIHLPKFWHA